MDDEELVEIGDEDDNDHLDNSARAKMLRKEARVSLTLTIDPVIVLNYQTIRNRESAQRSRNQRKAHLAYLEVRVAELEKENRALRSGETPPPTRSAEREASPANSVISLANDLGIPPEIVSSSGGVNLATVAPPPADLDVKPVVAPASPPLTNVQGPPLFGDMTINSLQAENAAIRERVGLLENLVKQVVALSNLGGIPSAQPPAKSAAPPTSPAYVAPQSFEWDAILNASNANAESINARLSATLSPPMFPVQPLDVATDLSISSANPALPSNTNANLACHPAVVVTCATSQALQRARTPSRLVPLEMSSARLGMMAKVVIAMAKLRDMSSLRSKVSTAKPLTWTTKSQRTRQRLVRRTEVRRRQWRQSGMKG